ncbi:hypothetical protein J7M28_10245, partial [bacterium]|nr:hypothetical protein [bacterium]
MSSKRPFDLGLSSATVVASISHRLFVTADGEIVDGNAMRGARVVIEDSRQSSSIEARRKVAGGLPVKPLDDLEDGPDTPAVRFRLCLDGAEFEEPYTGWLGRLLVLENGRIPRLYAVPHNPKYAGYRDAFGCALTWANGLCRAHGKCRNTYGQTPCEAPRGFRCDGTFATCKDRGNFAPCPLKFGEAPCLADPSGEPCSFSAGTCRAVGRGDYPKYGESLYSTFGLCRNTWSSCVARNSFLPLRPELHAYCQPRLKEPYELSLACVNGNLFVWVGQSEDVIHQDDDDGEQLYEIPVVWLATSNSIELRREESARRVAGVPCSEILDEMQGTPGATGASVADVNYSIGMASTEAHATHRLASVQWVTTNDESWLSPPGRIVVNRSFDGQNWSEDGAVFAVDDVVFTDGPAGSIWPATFERTEYRAPRVLIEGPNGPLLYSLKGRVGYHT